MKTKHFIAILAGLAALCVLVHFVFFRWDLTADKRYSLSEPTKEMMRSLDGPLEVRILLDGKMNASFLRLENATREMLDELDVYGPVHYTVEAPAESEKGIVESLEPMVIHERQEGGQTVQTTLYPYAVLSYQGRQTSVNLLRNNRGLSGEENINQSIEQLEFCFAEAISGLMQKEVGKIAFLEGHGELAEPYVYDLSAALARYFQVDRGTLTGNPEDLYSYKALIIADPQLPFSEADKFQLDQYVMHGGRILWAVDGVRFSGDILSTEGYTPVIALDLNIQDLLFRYGIRISPTLLEDMQCLPVPVDVSQDAANPNWQPMPWYYAPLLLTSQSSPITHNLAQVSSTFCSGLDLVGEDDGLKKEILLATSSATKVIGVPAEVDLSLIEADPSTFAQAYIPVAASIEGTFQSLFAHRMVPDSVQCSEILKESQPTRQIVIASGSIIRNEVQQGQALPLGYDRYTKMQFANRDFLVNCILYLSDDEGLISLRNREMTMRLLNDKRSHAMRTTAEVITIILPLLLLAIVGLCAILIRRKKYKK